MVLRGQSDSRSWRPTPLALGKDLALWLGPLFRTGVLQQEGQQVREASALFIGAALEPLPQAPADGDADPLRAAAQMLCSRYSREFSGREGPPRESVHRSGLLWVITGRGVDAPPAHPTLCLGIARHV